MLASAELERMVHQTAGSTSAAPPIGMATYPAQSDDISLTSFSTYQTTPPPIFATPDYSTPSTSYNPFPNIETANLSRPAECMLPKEGLSSSASPPAFDINAMAGPEPEPFILDLLYPGWPSDLPAPNLVSTLIDVYFTRPHAGYYMLNRGRFMTAFSFPPKHAMFPHAGLIHAMMAVAFTCVAPNAFDMSGHLYWRSIDGTEIESPAVYHAKRAKHHIDQAMEKGQKLLHIAQAIILVTMFSYANARFVEVWLCELYRRVQQARIGRLITISHRYRSSMSTLRTNGTESPGSYIHG